MHERERARERFQNLGCPAKKPLGKARKGMSLVHPHPKSAKRSRPFAIETREVWFDGRKKNTNLCWFGAMLALICVGNILIAQYKINKSQTCGSIPIQVGWIGLDFFQPNQGKSN